MADGPHFQIPLAGANCTNHHGRPGAGICVRCRRTYCSECVTKIGGVNLCPGCLETERDEQAAEAGRGMAATAAAATPTLPNPLAGPSRSPGSVGMAHRLFAWLVVSSLFLLTCLAIFLLSLSPAVLSRLATKLS